MLRGSPGTPGDEIGDEDRDAAGDAVGATSSSLIYRNAQSILQVMQSPSPPLLPLLRSALQAEILALILLNPEQEWSLTDLASRVGTAVSTAQREVSRAEGRRRRGVPAGREHTSGARAAVAHHRTADRAAAPVLRSTQVVAEEFDPSVASKGSTCSDRGLRGMRVRRAGLRPTSTSSSSAGPTATRSRMRRNAHVTDWGETNVTIRSLEWWRHGTDGFHAEVTTRPLVTIQAAPEGGDAP